MIGLTRSKGKDVGVAEGPEGTMAEGPEGKMAEGPEGTMEEGPEGTEEEGPEGTEREDTGGGPLGLEGVITGEPVDMVEGTVIGGVGDPVGTGGRTGVVDILAWKKDTVEQQPVNTSRDL
jgi:hypothetical protein